MLRTVLASVPFLALPFLGAKQGAYAPVSFPTGATVWVVDYTGGGDFDDLPEAVAAAAPGDVLLIQGPDQSTFDCQYSSFELDKGLYLLGRGSFPPRIAGGTVVTSLPEDQTAVFRGLHFCGNSAGLCDTNPSELDVLITLTANQGVVWIENCQVDVLGNDDGIHAIDSDAVVLARTEIATGIGYVGANSNGATNASVLVVDSEVHAFESRLIGKRGYNDFLFCPMGAEDGGTGVEVQSGSFFALDCEIQGGTGGAPFCDPMGFCGQAGDGGTGLVVHPGAEVRLVATTPEGGLGAPSVSCLFTTCSPGWPGIAFEGSYQALSGSPRGLQVETPVYLGEDYDITFTGPSGDLVYAIYGSMADDVDWPVLTGIQLAQDPVVFVLGGTIPSGGSLTTTVHVPQLTTTGPFTRFVQGIYFTNAGQTFLGSGSSLLLLSQ